MNDTKRRRELVRQLVATGRFRSQPEIVEALSQRGSRATQATVSRDLAALGAVRGMRGGAPIYLLPDDVAAPPDTRNEQRLRRLLADLPLTIDEAPPLLVLRTSPGGAHVIASAIDLSNVPGVVGTVAGDDTIFVACRGSDAVTSVRAYLESVQAGASPSVPNTPVRSLR